MFFFVGCCSLECLFGIFKVVMKFLCCWECKVCFSGSISNILGVFICIQCYLDIILNDNKIKCIVVLIRFFYWGSVWVRVLSGIMIFCELVCVVIVSVFFCYKEIFIVKVVNREISFLLFFGLMIGFLVFFVYIGKLINNNCKIQVILFGVSFVFLLLIVLVRIN